MFEKSYSQCPSPVFLFYNLIKGDFFAGCSFYYFFSVSHQFAGLHLLDHCVKSFHIRSYSGSYFPAFGLKRERYVVSHRIQSECRKVRTTITPNGTLFTQ